MDEQSIREIIRQVLGSELNKAGGAASPVPAGQAASLCTSASGGSVPLEVSARHVHLTRRAMEQLFAPGAKLEKQRDLSQPGEFLSRQRVKLVTAKGVIENVAVLGPERRTVQVELSMTDCRTLGVKAPVNLSGDLTGAGDVMIVGDSGCISAPGSVIVARAHIHMTPGDACRYGVRDGEHVRVRIQSVRPTTVGDVIVRVRENFALACHIDFDEANAACATCATPACIVGKSDAACRAVTGAPAAAQTRNAAPLFDGKLVTEAMAVTVREQGGTVQIKKGTVITPAARDIFTNAHMKIEIV